MCSSGRRRAGGSPRGRPSGRRRTRPGRSRRRRRASRRSCRPRPAARSARCRRSRSGSRRPTASARSWSSTRPSCSVPRRGEDVEERVVAGRALAHAPGGEQLELGEVLARGVAGEVTRAEDQLAFEQPHGRAFRCSDCRDNGTTGVGRARGDFMPRPRRSQRVLGGAAVAGRASNSTTGKPQLRKRAEQPPGRATTSTPTPRSRASRARAAKMPSPLPITSRPNRRATSSAGACESSITSAASRPCTAWTLHGTGGTNANRSTNAGCAATITWSPGSQPRQLEVPLERTVRVGRVEPVARRAGSPGRPGAVCASPRSSSSSCSALQRSIHQLIRVCEGGVTITSMSFRRNRA